MNYTLLLLVAFAVNVAGAQQVGIGISTPAPSLQLHVHNNSSDASIGLTNSTTGSANLRGMRLRLLQCDVVLYNYESTGSLQLATNFNTRLFIGADGNVGIGTTTPLQKLHVDGGIQFKGPLLPNGDGGASGQSLVSNGSLFPEWRTINSNPLIGFRATQNTEQAVAFAVETRVSFNSVSFNDGGGYNNISNAFTCPEDGVYRLECNVLFDVTASPSYPVTVLLKDNPGTVYAASARTIDAYNGNVFLSTLAKLNTGDQLHVSVLIGAFSGTAAQVISRRAGNYFTGYKVY